jgi:hypothetical protein
MLQYLIVWLLFALISTSAESVLRSRPPKLEILESLGTNAITSLERQLQSPVATLAQNVPLTADKMLSNGLYVLKMQGDGNLVLSLSGGYVWDSKTDCPLATW